MPSERPGRRYNCPAATKATAHGKPAVEHGFAGIAAKTQQTVPMVPSTANAALAVEIAIGEQFVIMLDGTHRVLAADLYASPAVGDPVYIVPGTNALTKTATGNVKFGLVEEVDGSGNAEINLNQRSAF